MGSTVAIIPARGGSKGIAGKNLAEVGGVPLVARAVQAAIGAERIDAVFVSSDDPAIRTCAELYGAGGLERPDVIAGDTASSESALLNALDQPAVAKINPDCVVMIQCTSPFTTSAELDALVGVLDDGQFDAALTVIEDHSFLWSRDENGVGAGINHDPSRPRIRRQDLPLQYRESGAAYAMRVGPFRETGTRFCGKVGIAETAHPPFEIDDKDDLQLARAIVAMDGRERQIDPARLSKIRALVTDFDGVHTDDRVVVDQEGIEAVRCSRSDGMGIGRLRNSGFPILILSKETNEVVVRRAEKLQVEVIHGQDDKLPVLENWAAEAGLTLGDICYVGNDINDLECLRASALGAVPSDAHWEAKASADLILHARGGDGAVREICEMLLAVKSN